MQDHHGDIGDLVGALDAAIYRTISRYADPVTGRRGAAALAPRLGLSPGGLANKANPLQDVRLTLHEAIPVQLAADDYAILHAFAQILGHAAYPLPPPADHVSDVELLDVYCDLHGRVGAMALRIRAMLRDHRVTPDELPALRAALDDLIRAALGVVLRIEALAE